MWKCKCIYLVAACKAPRRQVRSADMYCRCECGINMMCSVVEVPVLNSHDNIACARVDMFLGCVHRYAHVHVDHCIPLHKYEVWGPDFIEHPARGNIITWYFPVTDSFDIRTDGKGDLPISWEPGEGFECINSALAPRTTSCPLSNDILLVLVYN